MSNTLVSTNWLLAHLDDPSIMILDASYHLPVTKRDPDQEFIQQHIPRALRFSIDEISDHDTILPHMLPSVSGFNDAMQDLGVGAGSQIVVYDSVGLFSAARAWWMFRHFGHDRVAVLDGGLPAWLAAGCEVESGRGRVTPPAHPFRSLSASTNVVTADDLMANLKSNSALVLDARACARFAGSEPEPREGTRPGHIPGSINVPFSDLLDSHTGLMKTGEQLEVIFSQAGISSEPLVVSCGSGVTACVLALGLEIAGYQAPKLYDGSWSEWGSGDGFPLVTCEA